MKSQTLVLSPAEAASELRSGRVRHRMKVSGRLDLTGFPEERLPSGIGCYELDASNSNLTRLPEDLRIESRLILNNCTGLTSLPKRLTTGSISLRGCTALRSLPEGINTWFLDLTGCTQFEIWPNQGTIHHGSLVLRNCTSLRSLPKWIGRLSQLDLAGCVQIASIPNGVSVSSWVDVGGTRLKKLPASLQGASLRWRNVRINEEIAFHPEKLSAKQVLKETNAEIRRVMIERMGYLRFAKEAGAKVLDEDTDAGGQRQLLSIDMREDEALVGLSCRCPSTGRQYLLRVPPNTKSCHQAAAWMAGFDDPEKYNPSVET